MTAAGILPLCAPRSTALAGSVTQPGSTLGTSPGAPLAEGLYFTDTLDWGHRFSRDTTVNHPILIWSTPSSIVGARFQVIGEAAEAAIKLRNKNYEGDIYNPLLLGQLAWDLGNGFGVSYALGAYFAVDNKVAYDSTSLNQRLAVSYTGNGWNLTANAIYGHHFDKLTETANPDFLNIDLTITKKLGQWEVGPVAFGSADLTRPTPTYLKQRQLAVGGLVGYDFGPVRAQVFATREVHERNYGGLDTRVWGRLTIPIWTASTSRAVPEAVRND